jgi:predicted KAP-like P-loop ATPase
MMMEETKVEVLAIIPEDEAFKRILQAADDAGLLIRHEAEFDQAKNLIKREGYRFRIVLADVGSADGITDLIAEYGNRFPWLIFALYGAGADLASKGPTKKDIAQALQKLMVESQAQTLGRIIGGSPDPDSVFKTVMELLDEARGNLPSLPSPPYQAGKTQFLKEIGALLFSISLTERPWALEGDVFTLPVGDLGTLGNLGTSWVKELGKDDGGTLRGLARKKASETDIQPKSPVHDTFTYMEGADEHAIKLILATASAPPAATVMSAVEACLAAIDLATSLAGCKTLILPVIGGGSVGLPADEIIRGVLREFDPKSPLGELKHVIFTVYEPDVIKSITADDGDKIARVQRLENDEPAGPDRLRMESETKALADAIALKEMKPPLVVGVLGGWGTGKSFVLHLVKDRLSQLRLWNLTSETVRDKFPFVGHPYIVHFNAWTYAKSNLWASLMQQILIDLDRQLSLEKTLEQARSGLLRQGVDIWELLDDLTSAQLEDLKNELGAEAIAAFEGWKKSDSIGDSLWGVLQAFRRQERIEMQAAEKKLKKEEAQYELKIAEKQREMEEEANRQRRALEQELVQQNSALQIKIDKEKDALETAKRTAVAETDSEIQWQARKKAWDPALGMLTKFLGKSVDRMLADSGAKNGDAPLSIYSVVKELKLTSKYLRGLFESKHSIAFLVFAILSFGLPWVLAQFSATELIKGVTGAAGVLGGLLGSVYSALTKANREFEKIQADYEKRIEEGRRNQKSEREKLLQEKLSAKVQPIEARIRQLKADAKTETENFESEKQLEIDRLLETRTRELEAYKKKHHETIQDLRVEFERHQRRAGITGRTESLLDLVQKRIDSKFYDSKLGLLHQVQEDLQEVTDALLPINGFDWEVFPRGQPRIILIVDDLDRCPPKQVVKMLEAAQLLVKTELFVVLLAMDVRYVTRALEKKYDRILIQDGEPSGLDYIEKIVQIPYRVPGIAPGVMRSYLQGQMYVIEEVPPPPDSDLPDGEDDDREPDETITETGNPVFESSFDPEEEAPEEPMPTEVQQFSEKELSLMTECCNAASVSPRTGRRLVNVFKLMKIIWYHRGLHREPTHEVKHVMLFLLALSSAQPVIMRQVLHFLEEHYRKGDPTQNFQDALLECFQRSESIEGRPQTHHLLRELIENQCKFPEELTLEMVDLDNVRLVKSFSFVGEVSTKKEGQQDSEEKRAAGSSPSPGAKAGKPGRKKKTKKTTGTGS